MQRCEQRGMAAVVGQVIEKSHTPCANPQPTVGNASHKKVDGIRTLGEEGFRCPFTDVPEFGVQCGKFVGRIGSHASPHR